MYNVAAQGSPLESQHPKFLLEGMRGMVIQAPSHCMLGPKSQTPRWTAGVQHKPHCLHKPRRHTTLRLSDGEGWVQPQIQVPRCRQAFRKIVNSGLLCLFFSAKIQTLSQGPTTLHTCKWPSLIAFHTLWKGFLRSWPCKSSRFEIFQVD